MIGLPRRCAQPALRSPPRASARVNWLWSASPSAISLLLSLRSASTGRTDRIGIGIKDAGIAPRDVCLPAAVRSRRPEATTETGHGALVVIKKNGPTLASLVRVPSGRRSRHVRHGAPSPSRVCLPPDLQAKETRPARQAREADPRLVAPLQGSSKDSFAHATGRRLTSCRKRFDPLGSQDRPPEEIVS